MKILIFNGDNSGEYEFDTANHTILSSTKGRIKIDGTFKTHTAIDKREYGTVISPSIGTLIELT